MQKGHMTPFSQKDSCLHDYTPDLHGCKDNLDKLHDRQDYSPVHGIRMVGGKLLTLEPGLLQFDHFIEMTHKIY